MTLRTVDVWDLQTPIGVKRSREIAAVATDAEHRVAQARNVDARPVRTFEWQRDGVTDFEIKRIVDLRNTTAGCLPIDLWIRRRNALIWTSEVARGALSRSAHYGWAHDVFDDNLVAEDALAPPETKGTTCSLGTISSPSGPATLYQLVGRMPRREGRSYAMSLYVAEDTATDIALALRNGDDATSAGAVFEWTAGDLTVASEDTGVTASVEDVGSGWWRAVIVADATLAAPLAPSAPLEAVVKSDVSAKGDGAVFLWGAQLVLGDDPLAYMDVLGDRVSPVPVTIEDLRYERTGFGQNRAQVSFKEFID